jgi:hypothetical protein
MDFRSDRYKRRPIGPVTEEEYFAFSRLALMLPNLAEVRLPGTVSCD